MLGNIGTYSGPVGAIVVGLKDMIGVWQAWINAHGGLNGHRVKIIIADDQADPAVALTAAKRMVEKDHIVAFFDPFLMIGFNVIEPYAASVGIPIIGGDGNQPGWQTSKIAFPATAPTLGMSMAGTKYLVKRGLKKVGVAWCVDFAAVCSPYAKFVKATAPQLGADLVFNVGVSITAPSYTAQCINAKKAGVQGLWVVTDGASAVRMAKDCAAQDYHPTFVLIGMALQPSVASAPELDGSIVPSAVFPSAAATTPAMKAYRQAVDQYAPGLQLSGSTATVWASGALIVAASKYLSANPTPAEFLKGLYEIKNNTLGGLAVPLTFNKGGHVTEPNCAFMSGIEDGKWTAPIGDKLVC